MTVEEDLSNASPDIRWPNGLTPADADMFSHNELYLETTRENVWRRLVAATRWPEWYPNAKDVEIVGGGTADDMLALGTVFRWETFGRVWESRVQEREAPSRIGWTGAEIGGEPTAYHAWLLVEEATGCRVVTDEVGTGDAARALRHTDEGLMHRGHDLWLAALRFVVEGA